MGWMGALGASVLFEEPRCARSVCLRDWMRLADDCIASIASSTWTARARATPAETAASWMM
jgi:hypothetical protein